MKGRGLLFIFYKMHDCDLFPLLTEKDVPVLQCTCDSFFAVKCACFENCPIKNVIRIRNEILVKGNLIFTVSKVYLYL